MRKPTRPREVGRGERVLPGVWRLRLPLPWPAVPHCNAWAIAAGDGIVLIDTGTHEPGSLANLERALDQVGLRLEQVRLLLCTHAHADHCGQAGPIVERTGCELWAHPNLAHFNAGADDPEAAHARRVEIARQSGVPVAPPDRGRPLAAGPLAPDRDLVPGVEIASDLGAWSVHETPGHGNGSRSRQTPGSTRSPRPTSRGRVGLRMALTVTSRHGHDRLRRHAPSRDDRLLRGAHAARS